MRRAGSPGGPGASGACEAGKVWGLAGPVRSGNRGRPRRSGRVGVGGSGGQEIGDVPGGPGGSGGREIWGVNSRIVTIIFETENLFFSAREGYSAILLRDSYLGGAASFGFRTFPPCRGRCAGLKSGCGPFWVPAGSGPLWLVSSSFRPGGWRRGSVASLRTRLYPFQPAAASGICAGRGRRPPVPREPDSGGGHVHAEALPPVPAGVLPVQALPAGPGQSPRSRELQRHWTCRQPGAARRALPPVRNIRGSRGRRSPPCGRPLFPGPWSCRGRSCPRNGADGVHGVDGVDGAELAGADDGVPGGVARECVDLTGTGGLSERGPGVGAVVSPAGDHPFHRRGRRPPASCRLPRPRRGGGDPVRKPK